ncbi:D-alanyl-D-alanine carboxypeptidase [Actinoplanes sp. KI2]|uniref:D-alanyl-D-alanine carboxypeptidase family protein n=1 Tax=Actinoplanes sp. KI2 TaxID=2983315 RepID=UPI0021D5F40C|nr:D-alanyl-D-alanine carboxypeptidase [Actinoplanes sp. KI2]MCU7727021.1 D-alanyl-D-alanine carboxypeptidase [Actinoplanes sp. KI2]
MPAAPQPPFPPQPQRAPQPQFQSPPQQFQPAQQFQQPPQQPQSPFAQQSQFAPHPQPTPHPENPKNPKKAKGRKRLLAVLLPAILLIALASSGAAVQLHRTLPAATLTTTVASSLRIPGKLPTLPWPKAGSAELMIEGLGRLGGSGDNDPEAIGSVAKVMTAYLILKNHPLSGTDEGPAITVTAADVADYQSRIPSGQSLVKVAAGEKITEREALEALLLPSANNVAHMLGVWDAGSADGFLTKMNDAAQELGMKNTHYTDPSGFLPSTVSTAADQVLLGRAAIKDPVFAEIVALQGATIPVAGPIQNYNALLGEQGVFGIKTGSTGDAGGNLLFAAHLQVGGKTLTLVGAVFNQPGAHTPEQLAQVNRVVRKLLTAVNAAVKEYTLLADQPSGAVTTAWGATVPISPTAPLKVVGWPGLSFKVTTSRVNPSAEVTSGQVVGAVQAGSVRVNLATDAASSPPSLWWKLTRRP